MSQPTAQPTGWYIVKRDDGRCDIIPDYTLQHSSTDSQNNGEQERQQWGPFSSQGDAIARRVGLIRSGKCQPM
ncbi:MAG TPA: DDE transposase family protein [Elainellaceae cyanobacterium]